MHFSILNKSIFWTQLMGAFLVSFPCAAETVVTTYISTVQEERKSTRWTLTEWLRIKERTKLMDVWLAMFSDPNKDKFNPELNLILAKKSGMLDYTNENDPAGSDKGATQGSFGRAQLWLTNIFTGSTGTKLLNIDFGLEGGFSSIESYDPESESGVTYAHSRKILNSYYLANLRLFGKNIQDSSLVLKYGQYSLRNTFVNDSGANDKDLKRGRVAAAELQLYLFRWLGLEGNYFNFEKSSGKSEAWRAKGNSYDYGFYAEVSLLRLMLGKLHEEWEFTSQKLNQNTKEESYFAGIKVQL